MSKKLLNDPLSMVISPKVHTITDPNKVSFVGEDDKEHDPIFHKLYANYSLGKKQSHITRVSIQRIFNGFYKKTGSEWAQFTDRTYPVGIEGAKNAIKNGYRPHLHIYLNRNAKCIYDYVCPDDVHTYNAYLELGVKKIPVIIHGEIGELEESAFKIKGFKAGEKVEHFIHGMVCHQANSYLSVRNHDNLQCNDDPLELICLLEEIVGTVKSNFKRFHSDTLTSKIHYHHVTYSVLVRLGESLQAIRLLIANKLHLQSAHLLRSIYELALTLYISWISPHEIARFLQISSIMSEKEWIKLYEKILNEKKLSKQQMNDLSKANTFQYKLVAKVIEKAKFSPFGERYYNSVYSFLSRITHHDFSAVARYQDALEKCDKSVYSEDFQKEMLSILDFLTIFIVTKVQEDITQET